MRLLVVEVLRDLGYKPTEATHAEAALALLRANADFDLLISDVGLPGLNGRQLAELAREILPELKVLFITGYAATAINRRDFLGKDMDMISKPFALEDLGSKVREMLGGFR